jgi:flagellar hook-length control protein FliK
LNTLASALMATTAAAGPHPAGSPAGGPAAPVKPASALPALFAELVSALTGDGSPTALADGRPPPPGTAISDAARGKGLGLAVCAEGDSTLVPPDASPVASEAGPPDAVASPPSAGPPSPLAEALARLFDAAEALADPDAGGADPDTRVAEARSALDELNALMTGLGLASGSADTAPAPAAPPAEPAASAGALPAISALPIAPVTAALVDPSGNSAADAAPDTAAAADPSEPAAPKAESAPGRVVRLAAHLNALAGRIDTVAPDLAAALRALPAQIAPLLNAETPAPRPGAAQANTAVPASEHPTGRPAIGGPAAPPLPTPATEAARSDTASPPPSGDPDAPPLHPFGRPLGNATLHPAFAPDRSALASSTPAAPDMTALAVEIARRFEAGLNRFHIRLDPPELGRIEVRLDIDGNHLAARLAVDRPETLDILQRDARGLERALTQAGLGGDRPSLEFTLKHNPFAGRQNGDEAAPPWSANAAPPSTPGHGPAAATGLVYRGLVSAGGIDLYV